MALDLDAIKARLAALGDEPSMWRVSSEDADADYIPIDDRWGCRIGGVELHRGAEREMESATFIAHAPEDIAYLLDEVERLRGERDDLVTQRLAGTPGKPYVVSTDTRGDGVILRREIKLAE